jgi:hypothetical protein
MTEYLRQVAPRTASGQQVPFDPRTQSFLTGDSDDAKFIAQPFSLPPLTDTQFNASGVSLVFDQCSPTNGDVMVSFDTCFPFMAVKTGTFIRTRRFNKVILRNTTGVTITGQFCYSENPNFLVVRGLS